MNLSCGSDAINPIKFQEDSWQKNEALYKTVTHQFSKIFIVILKMKFWCVPRGKDIAETWKKKFKQRFLKT
ncbi:hypothetical protein KI387_011123, partial [Taxus chinensis]